MFIRPYDNRQGLIDNWRFGIWKPFICWAKGHDYSCYGVTPGRGIISSYFLICHRCMEMSPDDEELLTPCGFETCRNTCRPREEENYVEEGQEGQEPESSK